MVAPLARGWSPGPPPGDHAPTLEGSELAAGLDLGDAGVGAGAAEGLVVAVAAVERVVARPAGEHVVAAPAVDGVGDEDLEGRGADPGGDAVAPVAPGHVLDVAGH